MTRRPLVLLVVALAAVGYGDATERTWVPASLDNHWNTPTNWSPTGVPVTGDTIVFPAVTTPSTTINDLPGSPVLHGLRVAGDQWTLTGNTLAIDTAITLTGTGRGCVIALPLVLPTMVQFSAAAGGGGQFSGTIMGPGGIRKTGAGGVVLAATNGYAGATAIEAGVVVLAASGTLGSTGAGTTVSAGAALLLEEVSTAEPLTLAGSGFGDLGALTAENASDADTGSVASGPIALTGAVRVRATHPHGTGPVIAADPALLDLSGPISGGGLVVDCGTPQDHVRLSGSTANTYAGGTDVVAGEMQLAKSGLPAVAVPGTLRVRTGAYVLGMAGDQLANRAALTIDTGGVLTLGGDELVATIAGGGVILLANHELQVGGRADSMTWSGSIGNSIFGGAGSGRLRKTGIGTFTWAVSPLTSTIGDGLYVEGGVARIDASVPGVPVRVYAIGRIAGTGVVGPITATGGWIDPGPVGGAGTLTCGGLSLGSGSRLVVDWTATAADVLQVNGTVALSGGVVLPLVAGGLGTTRTIIVNDSDDAVAGTFAGWSGPAVSYVAGTGNDVAITPTATVLISPTKTLMPEDAPFPLTVSVAATAAPASAITVGWQTVDGTARAIEGDYVAGSGALTLPAGSTASATFPITVLDDSDPEPDEWFQVALVSTSSGVGVAVPGTDTITITRNDGFVPPPPPPSTGGGGSSGCGAGSGLGVAAAALVLALAFVRRR